MNDFEIDFEYKIREYGATTLSADNAEQAEEFALEYIKETFDDIEDIVITGVRQI